MMKITVIGCGYVGLVTATGLAEAGHLVTGIDRDRTKINKLRHQEVPFYEKGLAPLIRRHLQSGRLSFTTSPSLGMASAQVIFIAVGTPPAADGSVDLSQVQAVAAEIGQELRGYTVIVMKSTVPVGTTRKIQTTIGRYVHRPVPFDVVSNPEFLREGNALYDFMNPDRIVIGADTPKALQIMEELYRPFLKKKTPLIRTNPETAELIKYASNAFLATKISFINEMAELCEAVGADLPTVARGMGLDHRIGPEFLAAGPGYGGSCFPKDTKALIQIARAHGKEVTIVEATDRVNMRTKKRMLEKIIQTIGPPAGKTIALLGLAFKANTDDLRESPALPLIEGLLAAGVRLRVHDPKALTAAEAIFGSKLKYYEDEYAAAEGAEALVLVTEWEQYRKLDFSLLKTKMAQAIFIDLRNLFTPEKIRAHGFVYESIGRGKERAEAKNG
ncbi:MAG TPA: UDP-glucose/GDP-mannose dehydrogenase family protein [Firmicutes bacterium]|nr:UDP-glucose/GDP-mannose dehydrogenase family protein [Bacillota bacterium]